MRQSITFILLVILTLKLQSQITFKPLSIPVRDGKTLAADLYARDTSKPKPVILVQTPYNKAFYRLPFSIPGLKPLLPYDTSAFNYVILDWRGFYASTAAYVAGYDRGLDGYDAVEWIAQQPWCNGKVGTSGESALGMVQFQTVKHKPPHLVCAMPMEKDFKTKYEDFYYGGVFRKEHVESVDSLGLTNAALILSQPLKNIYWNFAETNSDMADSVEIPMLLVSGWYDHYPSDILRAFSDLGQWSSPAVRQLHKLVYGPWIHGALGKSLQGELSYPEATNILDTLSVSFFRRYLLNEANGYENQPAMRYFVLGSNTWHSTPNWPAAGMYRDSMFLTANGLLQKTKPAYSSISDSFTYDPRDPSPSYGGSRFSPFNPAVVAGPLNISQVVESRSDYLAFETTALYSTLKIRGKLTARLYISSNRTDTDFGIRLCDVFPDGRSMIITQGIKRGRLRNSLSTASLLVPGQLTAVDVELNDLAIDLLPGHKLRVIITSSNYPMFDINLNNGGAMYTAGDTLTAVNHIYHGNLYPSCLVWKTNEIYTSAGDEPAPEDFKLNLYPNPSKSVSAACFTLEKATTLTISLVDPLGRVIKTFASETVFAPGTHQLHIETGTLSPGLYSLVLASVNFREAASLVVIR